MTIRIQNLQPKEISKAINFYETLLGPKPYINKVEILKRIKENTGIFLAAKDNDKIVGIKFTYIDGKTAIGRGIAVSEEYRKQGIATSLISEFERQVKKHKEVEKYVFASATEEGIPFHIKMGYKPTLLIQFKDKILRDKLDLTKFNIIFEQWNDEYNVYQIYIALSKNEQSIDYFGKLQEKYPELNIQFQFEKLTKDL